MQLYNYINLDQLERHIESGLVSRQFHPCWPLAILNYTQEAMGKIHDDLVLRACRGLIYNFQTMEIVARPMKAFFNYNDDRYFETVPGRGLPPTTAYHEVTEKMDGSLGIVYQYRDNLPEIATRGSFVSEQAQWATEHLRCAHLDHFTKVPESMTLLVEIIYPENRIVVDYHGVYELALHTVIFNETGLELKYPEMVKFAEEHRLPFTIVPYYPEKEIAQCANENERNREGYVVKYFVPGVDPIRIKIKFEDYRLAHRAMFGMHNRDVWELLKDGKEIDLENFRVCPQGFIEWLTQQINTFQTQFKFIELQVYDALSVLWYGEWTRKDIAEFFKARAVQTGIPWLMGVLFAAYDNKNYQAIIWKGLRPERAIGYVAAQKEEPC